MKYSEIPKDVQNIIKNFAKEIGKYEDENFDIGVSSMCAYIKSPIEQILYSALVYVAQLNYIKFGDDTVFFNEKEYLKGFHMTMQEKIGNYRVDFLVGYYRPLNMYNKFIDEQKEVIVECDSQQFHESDEKQRRYEKERDRYLQSKGYVVFHYTGKQIMQKPAEIAAEILSFITGKEKGDFQLDSNIED